MSFRVLLPSLQQKTRIVSSVKQLLFLLIPYALFIHDISAPYSAVDSLVPVQMA